MVGKGRTEGRREEGGRRVCRAAAVSFRAAACFPSSFASSFPTAAGSSFVSSSWFVIVTTCQRISPIGRKGGKESLGAAKETHAGGDGWGKPGGEDGGLLGLC